MNYKEFNKVYIGGSDVATLVAKGYFPGEGVRVEMIKFGSDGEYHAYMVDEKNVEIGEHYNLVATFNKWATIYDDEGFCTKLNADIIKIYRSGDYGCIIHLINLATIQKGKENE